jgi:hypothetical protein
VVSGTPNDKQAEQSPSVNRGHKVRGPDYRDFMPMPDMIYDVADCSPYTRENSVREELGMWFGFRIKPVIRALNELGFHRVSSHVMKGGNAVVLEGPHHRVVRLCVDKREPLNDSPLVLKPLVSRVVRGIRIDVMPKVHTLDEVMNNPTLKEHYQVIFQDRPRLISQLIEDSIRSESIFYDISPNNIALVQDKNGKTVPLILDNGALAMHDFTKMSEVAALNMALRLYREKMVPDFLRTVKHRPANTSYVSWTEAKLVPPDRKKEIFSYLEGVRQAVKDTPLTADYAQVQRDYVDSLKPREGGVSVGSSKAEIKHKLREFVDERRSYKKTKRTDGTRFNPKQAVYAKMLADGCNPAEIASIFVAALMNHHGLNPEAELPEGAGFCDHVRMVRERRDAHARERATLGAHERDDDTVGELFRAMPDSRPEREHFRTDEGMRKGRTL